MSNRSSERLPLEGLSLEGKAFVIVGGSTGLGFSGARACVAAGARVLIVGRHAETVNDAVDVLGASAGGLVADASHPETADRAILELRSSGLPFSGLYHVAGGSGRRFGDGPLHEITDDGWRETTSLNLDSVFYSNRAATRALIAAGEPGSIVNMSSVLAFSPSPRHFTTHAYATAKAAIIGLTKSAASHYARSNIRFNAIAPALFETPMAARATGDDEIMRFVETKQPLDGGRAGAPADVDAAVVYFLSDASRFVTGQVLAIDGGWCVSDGQHGGWAEDPRDPQDSQNGEDAQQRTR